MAARRRGHAKHGHAENARPQVVQVAHIPSEGNVVVMGLETVGTLTEAPRINRNDSIAGLGHLQAIVIMVLVDTASNRTRPIAHHWFLAVWTMAVTG